MKMNKFIVSVVAAAFMLTVAGCGGQTDAAVSGDAAPSQGSTEDLTPGAAAPEGMTSPADEIAAESGHQNPIMNYVGAYSDENGKPVSLLVQATDEENGVYFTVSYIEDGEYYELDLYGNMENNVITYKQGGCKKLVPDPESEEGVKEESIYEDGTGSFVITEENKITWTDDKENKGEGSVFVWDEELNKELQQNASAGEN